MKKFEVLMTTTDKKYEFKDLNDFSTVLILDEIGNVASVYVKGKMIGKIYDSDIDRVRDQRSEIVVGYVRSEKLKGAVRNTPWSTLGKQ